MRLGVIGNRDILVVDQKGDHWNVYEFAISVSALSFFEIMHSAFSTPARYIMEVFRRLDCLEEGAATKPLFIFNPLFHTDRLTMMLVLKALRDDVCKDGVAVVTDKADRPIGYLFPTWVDRQNLHLLTLLSTVNGEIDAELIGLLFHTQVKCHSLARLDLKRAHHNGFLFEQIIDIYRWLAIRSIAYMEFELANGGGQEWQKRSFTAIMPRHAGDVLFFSLAYSECNSYVTRIALNRAYRDIAVNNAPQLAILNIDPQDEYPLKGSGQAETERESDYFDKYKNSLPLDGFYYFARQSRDANSSIFHLIDHFAFALGAHCCTSDSLYINRWPMPPPCQPDIAQGKPHVLLHFDGGWPLKVYPRHQQERLIDLLYAKGFSITVLAGKDYHHPKCHVTTFKNYDKFLEIVGSSHIIVGMDSFPVHYAIFVQGLPAICLFANTRPENASAPLAINYSCLERGLACRPCNGVIRCPLYGRDYCNNFVNPERVADEVIRMLDVVGNSAQSEGGGHVLVGVDSCRPRPVDMNQRVRNITLGYINLKIALWGPILPYLGYLSLFFQEFSASVRIDGLLGAGLRTLRFLRRVYRW